MKVTLTATNIQHEHLIHKSHTVTIKRKIQRKKG